MNYLIKLCILIAGFLIFSTSVFADHCEFWGPAGMCYFDSFNMNPESEAYFHCDTSNAVLVSMVNHHLLISGFTTDRGVGAGKYSNVGLDTKAILDQYYFAVRNDPSQYGIKHVLVIAVGTIDCKIGKGNRNARFPGLYGHES